MNDSELVLAAGTPDGWGVALISDTGSVCLARTPEGDSAGRRLGPADGGRGQRPRLACNALRLAAQAADGR